MLLCCRPAFDLAGSKPGGDALDYYVPARPQGQRSKDNHHYIARVKPLLLPRIEDGQHSVRQPGQGTRHGQRTPRNVVAENGTGTALCKSRHPTEAPGRKTNLHEGRKGRALPAAGELAVDSTKRTTSQSSSACSAQKSNQRASQQVSSTRLPQKDAGRLVQNTENAVQSPKCAQNLKSPVVPELDLHQLLYRNPKLLTYHAARVIGDRVKLVVTPQSSKALPPQDFARVGQSGKNNLDVNAGSCPGGRPIDAKVEGGGLAAVTSGTGTGSKSGTSGGIAGDDRVDGGVIGALANRVKSDGTDVAGRPTKQGVVTSRDIERHIRHRPRTESGRLVTDPSTGTKYRLGKLLGKGGFAKCYDIFVLETNEKLAAKVITKHRLAKSQERDKIQREIDLHRDLLHQNVVAFKQYFEVDGNAYIILENCSQQSLVHVLNKRRTLTEPEVRYYMRHLVSGLEYVHSRHIVHRDLKLGNMLLDDRMQLKIADFGLATRLHYDGERKMTVCGTPNYIAPEVLQKLGHSYPADVWAMGCIMYTMLCGHPPFETNSLKETYALIMAGKFSLPRQVSPSARRLITRLLSVDAESRPSLTEVLEDAFFKDGYTPVTLHTACCHTAPRYPAHAFLSRSQSDSASTKDVKRSVTPVRRSTSQIVEQGKYRERQSTSGACAQRLRGQIDSAPATTHTSNDVTGSSIPSAVNLYQLLTRCLDDVTIDNTRSPPMCQYKSLWVTKWVDYSNKYGFGFQLADRRIGILFNDTTRMLLSADGKTVYARDDTGCSQSFTTDAIPAEYQKRVTLALYFAQYMSEHLVHGADVLPPGELTTKSIPDQPVFMRKWRRTDKAILLYLSNGTLQVNFFKDHTKVVLAPSEYGSDYIVTHIDGTRQVACYRLTQLTAAGCTTQLAQTLREIQRLIVNIVNVAEESV